MSQTPICLDMLSCYSIGLRDAAPLMDELSVCLTTLKAAPGSVTDGSLVTLPVAGAQRLLDDGLISIKGLLKSHRGIASFYTLETHSVFCHK